MHEELLIKIEEAEKKLAIRFPAAVRGMLLSLNDFGKFFGEEEWFFDLFNDVKNGTNTIVEDSLSFREDWKIEAVVFAQNGVGDYLLLLPKLYPQKIEGQLDEIIYAFWHETGEIRIFAYDLAEALDPDFSPEPEGSDFVFRINEDDTVEEGFELRRIYDPVAYLEYLKRQLPPITVNESATDPEGEEWLRLHERLNQVSEWIDSEQTDKIEPIFEILEECTGDEFLGPRANLILSKIYMKGFGIPVQQEKAIQYVLKSASAGNYTAMADLSFYYYQGIGVPQSTLKAIEWMESANEKSEGLFEENLAALKNFQTRNN